MVKRIFIDRTFNNFKTIQSMYTAWGEQTENGVTRQRFHYLLGVWNLTNYIDMLFDWLDVNKDGIIGYDDLMKSIGPYISPGERIFFRQDVKPSKSTPCCYPNCWEDLRYLAQSDSKLIQSKYCPLHQQLGESACKEIFKNIQKRFSPEKLELFHAQLAKVKNCIKIGKFRDLILEFCPVLEQNLG